MQIEIFKIIGIAFVTAITSILLKSTKPELSFAVTIVGIIIILLIITGMMKNTILALEKISKLTNIDNGILKLLLKITGIGYITEFCAGVLKDFGSETIGDKVLLGGKITILILSLPIIETILKLITEFLELI